MLAALACLADLAACDLQSSPSALVDAGDGGLNHDATNAVEATQADASPDVAAGDADGAWPPAACAVTPPGTWRATWPMPDPARAAGSTAPSYDVSQPGMVVDRVTGLMWQRQLVVEGQSWPNATQTCACLTLGGHDDWRLPTRLELVSLVNFLRERPAIDGDAFPDNGDDWFWTSSPGAGAPGVAWYVAFFDGDSHQQTEDTAYRFRCVRAPAPAVAVPLQVRDDGTVVDPATGLTWQRTSDAALRTWSEAAATCGALTLAGGATSPWRLPNPKELQTIVDETASEPAIDTTVFPDNADGSYWASAPLAGGTEQSWFVDFRRGIAYNSPNVEPHRVRCVRPTAVAP